MGPPRWCGRRLGRSRSRRRWRVSDLMIVVLSPNSAYSSEGEARMALLAGRAAASAGLARSRGLPASLDRLFSHQHLIMRQNTGADLTSVAAAFRSHRRCSRLSRRLSGRRRICVLARGGCPRAEPSHCSIVLIGTDVRPGRRHPHPGGRAPAAGRSADGGLRPFCGPGLRLGWSHPPFGDIRSSLRGPPRT